MIKQIKGLIGSLYLKLVKINDTPQRVSLGLGLGVLLGLIPGTGPVAALTLAVLFRLNRFAALMGCLAVNTWLSLVTLIPAIKLGAKILGLEWPGLYQDWLLFLRNFHWSALLKISIYKIILPVTIGYIILGLAIAVIVYLFSLSLLLYAKRQNKN